MGATVSRDLLADALSQVVRVVGTRSIIPELRIEAGQDKIGQLKITGTDGEHWIGLTVPCFGDFDECLIPAQRLNDVAQALVGEEVEINRAGSGLNLNCGRSRRSLGTLPTDRWPERTATWPEPVKLDGARFAECLRFTLPHIARNDPSVPYLGGVHLIASGGRLRAIGCDRYIIANIEVCETQAEFAATITPKLAEAATRLTGEIALSVSERAVRIEWDGGYIDGPQVIDGYPIDLINKTVTHNFPSVAITDGSPLLAAIRGVRPVGRLDTASGSSVVAMTLDRDRITLTTNSGEGSATDELPADWSGDELHTGFAAIRAERVISGFGDAVLRLGFDPDPKKPIRFTADGQPDRVALLYPMRV